MRREDIRRLSDPAVLRRRRLRASLHEVPLRWRGRWALIAVMALALGVGLWWFLYGTPVPPTGESQASIPRTKEEPAPPLVTLPLSLPPSPPPYQRRIEVQTRRGDTLFDLLCNAGIPPSRVHELVVAAKPVHDLARLRDGTSISLDYDERNGRILRLELDLDGESRLVVERSNGKLHAKREPYAFQIRPRVVQGVIEDSLFVAADEAGLPPALTLELAEIFGWDIDFHVDMRRGDRFGVLFEEKYLDGRPVRHGRILAARIQNQGKTFWAVYFRGRNGHADYYDLDGRSLRKVFLKSPLKFTRISSGYSYRRLHPILKIYRPHLGVDYAAPLGTPVRAIGDGRVVFAGWKGGYGRFIKIRHNSTYTSTYGHLHRFAKGIRRGRYVRQGQIIGYVGKTGLATGPHLDFRLLKNGRFVNPLKVNFPSADPVQKADIPQFRRQVDALLAWFEGKGPSLARTEQGKEAGL